MIAALEAHLADRDLGADEALVLGIVDHRLFAARALEATVLDLVVDQRHVGEHYSLASGRLGLLFLLMLLHSLHAASLLVNLGGFP